MTSSILSFYCYPTSVTQIRTPSREEVNSSMSGSSPRPAGADLHFMWISMARCCARIYWRNLSAGFCAGARGWPVCRAGGCSAGGRISSRKLARRVTLDPANLPHNQEFLTWPRAEHSRGPKLLLVTAADEIFAAHIAGYLGIFEGVISGDGAGKSSGEARCPARQGAEGAWVPAADRLR